MIQGRLLPYDQCDAVTNMATDEAISRAVAEKQSPPTLRFYGWNIATLSLGYFQKHGESLAYAKANCFATGQTEIVRRSTGGGAILHDRDLTYSLSLPLDDNGPGSRDAVYQTVHASIQASLAEIGVMCLPYREFDDPVSVTAPTTQGLIKTSDEPFLCFQRRTAEDLVCSGYKILGSAQRRVRGGLLQHGSLLLGVSRWASVLPGIGELTDVVMDPVSLSQAIAGRVGEAMGIQFHAGQLSDPERALASEIATDRYAAEEWTRRR